MHLYVARVTPIIEDDNSRAFKAIENNIQLIRVASKKQKGPSNPYKIPERIVHNSPIPPQSAKGAISVASTTTKVVKEKNV